MSGSILDEIKDVIGLILDLEPDEVNEETGADNTEAWDSFAQLQILLALEEKYGVEFLPEDFEEMVSVNCVMQVMERKLNR